MKFLILICMLFSVNAFCQDAPPVAPVIAPVIVPSQAPALSPEAVAVVPVASAAAPPKWAEQLIVSIEKLPVIGPLASKAMVYLGILSSILTALVAFLLAALSAISGVSNIAGLAAFAAKIEAFKSGPIMYWIKYLSMFNSQKPPQSNA